jgi:hypothetical protein
VCRVALGPASCGRGQAEGGSPGAMGEGGLPVVGSRSAQAPSRKARRAGGCPVLGRPPGVDGPPWKTQRAAGRERAGAATGVQHAVGHPVQRLLSRPACPGPHARPGALGRQGRGATPGPARGGPPRGASAVQGVRTRPGHLPGQRTAGSGETDARTEPAAMRWSPMGAPGITEVLLESARLADAIFTRSTLTPCAPSSSNPQALVGRVATARPSTT